MTDQVHPTSEGANPAYLNVTEAAAVLRLGVSTLNKLRVRGGGPSYLKLGRRVVYRTDDLTEWAGQKARQSTSEAPRMALW
jgi:predicted DNA-binding transcriptional regulator AlpA